MKYSPAEVETWRAVYKKVSFLWASAQVRKFTQIDHTNDHTIIGVRAPAWACLHYPSTRPRKDDQRVRVQRERRAANGRHIAISQK